MPRSSPVQSSFLGGEWGPLSRGRIDDPRYSTAMELSLNGFPVEEGAWTRRGGTQLIVPTVGRTYGKLLGFEGSETCSFAMEFTNNKLRLMTQSSVVFTNDAQTVTGSNGATREVQFSGGAPGWSVGDLVQFVFPDASSPLYPYPISLEGGMRSGVFQILSYATGTAASGYVTFNGQPAVNDTLTIHSTVITFKASGATGNQVNIGANIAATLANLQAFLLGAGSPFTTMSYYTDGVSIQHIQATATGTAGNAFTLSTTSANIAVSGATLSGGTSSGSTIILADDLGNAITQTWPIGALIGAQVMRHKILATTYSGVPVLSALRAVQAEVNSIILSNTVTPSEVQITVQGTATTDPVLTFSALTLVDGPYNDPQTQSLTMSALTGTVTLTAGSAVFAATDVGRAVRIFTQPAAWASGTSYTTGQQVTDSNGAWWTALQNTNPGEAPGSAATRSGIATIVWGPAPTAGSWAWGLITAYTNSTHVTFAFDTTIPGMVLNSGNGTTAAEWRIGVYSGTTGYPTCGVFYEGRLWLAGCVLNRFDTTTSNGVSQVIGTNTATFSPTDPNGNVLDDSGMSEVLNSSGINQIQWMLGDAGGVLMGTLHGETLVGASVLGDPITPTSIQAHEHTRYGSVPGVDAIRAGMVVVFAQKAQRRLMEYLDDAFSGKPTGRHLNEHSKHLSQTGIAQLAYLEEPVPMVFALMNNGMLTGCTYRRFSRFVQTPPEAAGWHWNMHGAGRAIINMCTVPGNGGLRDHLFVVTNPLPPNAVGSPFNNYFIEVMQSPLDPGQDITQSWFVDQVVGGVGNSGFDCGGGNPSSFTSTGGVTGADTSSNVPTDLFANQVLGQSPPWGGVNVLGKGGAVYFPGSVALYNLPKYGQKHSPPVAPTDVHSLSMSVWIGTNDLPYEAGMLLSSPSLSYAQANTTTDIVSGLLGGPTRDGTPTDSILAISQWGLGYPGPAEVDFAHLTGSLLTWTHIMISAKTDGAGNIVVTAAANDTVLYSSQSQGTVGNNNHMWSFNSQQDNIEDNGLNCWCIGGQFVEFPVFDLNIQNKSVPFTFTIPSLLSLIESGALGTFGKPRNGFPYPLQIYAGPGPDFTGVDQDVVKTEANIISQVSGSGGPQNIPYETSLGAATGFVGNVAELWIQPNVFIDWTSSVNRNKFHEFDTISDSWGPIDLGVNGATPGFGTPWIYLSGGPRVFPINRATGLSLTEIDTINGPIDFDTGLTGGLQASELNFP